MPVLYRKYRPQFFADVIGQPHIVRTLKNQASAGTPAHAYLFTGSRGVGKTTLARILAKALNCEKNPHASTGKLAGKPSGKSPAFTGEPCGSCSACRQVSDGVFLDMAEIDAASNTGVDNIRDLIEHVKFSPSQGVYKVFIIDEVHMLSKGAFNALLKTLEEPPEHAVFVLATTEISKVPPTIVSRTQRFDFRRLSPAELAVHLGEIAVKEKLKLSPEILALAAENAEGSARDALGLLDKLATLGDDPPIEECRRLLGLTDTGACFGLLGLVLQGKNRELPGYFDRLSEQGTDFAAFNRDFLEYLRQVLVFSLAGEEAGEMGEGRLAAVSAQASLAGRDELIFIVRLFLRAYKELAFSPRAELPLLLAALEAAARRAGALPEPSGSVPSQAASSEAKVRPPDKTEKHAPAAETLSLPQVALLWPALVEGVKKRNGPLANLLKNSRLDRIEGNVLVVEVKFSFHQQSLSGVKNQQLLREIIRQQTGVDLAVRAEVRRVEESKSSAADLSQALEVFGGEILQ